MREISSCEVQKFNGNKFHPVSGITVIVSMERSASFYWEVENILDVLGSCKVGDFLIISGLQLLISGGSSLNLLQHFPL